MKKIVYESLFEYRENVGYTERIDEGFKNSLLKALATIILTSSLSLKAKEVKAMSSNEIKDKLEKVEDKTNKDKAKIYKIEAEGNSKEEALKNLTQKITDFKDDNNFKVVGTGEVTAGLEDNKVNIIAEIQVISKLKDEGEDAISRWKIGDVKKISTKKRDYRVAKNIMSKKLNYLKEEGIEYEVVDSGTKETEDGYEITVKLKRIK